MRKLSDLATVIRSKNAGPFELTFDVMFATVVYVPALLPEAWYCTA